jgi:hypothetical protein
MNEFIAPPLNPVSLFFTVIMCIAIINVKKEYMVIPLLLTACFMTTWQMLIIFNINFPMLRLLVIAGLLSITLRNEWRSIKLNVIDKLLIYYFFSKIVLYSLLWLSSGALSTFLDNRLIYLVSYFLIRSIISDFTDLERIFKIIILMSIPVACFMLYEQLSGGYNFFPY